MQDAEKLSQERILGFWKRVKRSVSRGRSEGRYGSGSRLLRKQSYREQGKKMRGLPRRYMSKMTGLSRTQVTRLVRPYMEHSEVKEASYRRNRFPSRFTRGDIELLAEVG